MLTIDFLRHGELEGGVKYRGALDEALTEDGRAQMDEIWGEVNGNITKIISSPLSRCAQPAQDWAAKSSVPLAIEDSIKELSYGLWEGLTAQEIQQQFPNQLEAWRKDPTDLTPPQGESMKSFAERTSAFWQYLLAGGKDEHVLIVAHSGSIRLLLAHALNAPIQTTRHLAMPYACWSRVQIKEKQVQLMFHAR